MKKKSFTFIEILLTIILIGIMATVVANNINTNYSVYDYQNLKNNLLNYENYVKINNNIELKPNSNSFKDKEKTKYWFKQNLKFVISSQCNEIFSYIMNDKPYKDKNKNFDKIITDKSEIIKTNGYYDIGLSNKCNNEYPPPELTNKSFLYKYITKIKIYKDGKLIQTITKNNNNNIDIIFYNNTIYLNEGLKGDNGSVVFYDTERDFVKNDLKLVLYDNNDNNYTININSIGFIN